MNLNNSYCDFSFAIEQTAKYQIHFSFNYMCALCTGMFVCVCVCVCVCVWDLQSKHKKLKALKAGTVENFQGS
jgi:hypothetical protein